MGVPLVVSVITFTGPGPLDWWGWVRFSRFDVFLSYYLLVSLSLCPDEDSFYKNGASNKYVCKKILVWVFCTGVFVK